MDPDTGKAEEVLREGRELTRRANIEGRIEGGKAAAGVGVANN